ncbi:FAD-binding oxidoreductase [Marinicellulosiphila megalodicopiae]|uniref:FAD-binding oxidoreductase n=1 Tax=Marinicellulosiphila megalodicopiae TaxID=2724896 RepID=UPI003BAF918B
MTIIHYQNLDVELKIGETLLDGLLRNGFDVPCGCKAGKCQSCLVSVKSTNDSLKSSQYGVNDTQKSLGYVLSCQFKPLSNTTITPVSANGKQIEAIVIDKVFLNDNVVRIRLKAPFEYITGQYVTLYKNAQIARSYSIVSHPIYHDFIELHIRILKNGVFSQWIKNDVWVGHKIGVQGPMGDCVYKKENRDMLLIATGTGIAPIYGIVQDAIINGHKKDIQIVYAAMRYKDLYLAKDLQVLLKKYSNIKLHLITQYSSGIGACKQDVYQYVQEKIKNLSEKNVYVCGVDSFVKKMKKKLISNGLNLANLSYESFLSFEPTDEGKKPDVK